MSETGKAWNTDKLLICNNLNDSGLYVLRLT